MILFPVWNQSSSCSPPLQAGLPQEHGPDAVGHLPHGGRGRRARAGEGGVAVGRPRLQEVARPRDLLGEVLRELQARARDEGEGAVVLQQPAEEHSGRHGDPDSEAELLAAPLTGKSWD